MSPLRTANWNAVVPPLERARRSAPSSSSVDAIALSPSAAAHISAVCPLQASFAFTSAPARASALTASTLAERAAVISGVSPAFTKLTGSFGFAPALSSRSSTAGLPCCAARASGVTP